MQPKLPEPVVRKVRGLIGDFKIEHGDAMDVHQMLDYIYGCEFSHDCNYTITPVEIGGDARTPPTTYYLVHLFTVKGDDQVIVVSPDSIYVAVPM